MCNYTGINTSYKTSTEAQLGPWPDLPIRGPITFYSFGPQIVHLYFLQC